MGRKYCIYDSRPAYCYGGGHKFNAFPTFNQPWEAVRELLPPDVCNYTVVAAPNKAEAVKEARRRWGS